MINMNFDTMNPISIVTAFPNQKEIETSIDETRHLKLLMNEYADLIVTGNPGICYSHSIKNDDLNYIKLEKRSLGYGNFLYSFIVGKMTSIICDICAKQLPIYKSYKTYPLLLEVGDQEILFKIDNSDYISSFPNVILSQIKEFTFN